MIGSGGIVLWVGVFCIEGSMDTGHIMICCLIVVGRDLS